jgi:type I restriction enzyme S subunit
MTAMQTGMHYPIDLEALPVGWEKGYVGDFALEIQPGFASGKHNKEGRGIPHIRPYNIGRSGKLDLSEIKSVDPEADTKRLHSGDVLFNNTNSPELIGKTTVITATDDWGFSNHMTRVAFPDAVSPKFAAYQLHYLWSRGYFLHNCVKHVNQASVSSTTLARTVPFVKPPRPQQDSIVAEIEKQFSRLDEAVANLKRVKANLKRYKAAVLKAAVEGKFVSSNPSVVIQHYTSGWIRSNLGAILTTIEAGKSFKCAERLPSIREIGVVKVSAVTWGTYNEEESKTCLDPDRIEARYFVKPGDFLFSRANTIQLVGACVIVQKVTRRVMLSDKILRFRFSDKVVPQWVLYWLRSDTGRKEIQRLSTGNQESMRNIGQDRIRQIAFAIPALDEQKQIVAEVERRLSVIEELETAVQANLTRADRLRQSILSQAFAGKLTCVNTNRTERQSTDIETAKA